MLIVRRCALALIACLAAASCVALPSAGATTPPAPFSDRDVKVTPIPGQQGAFDVSFNSSLLNRRVHNSVFLPTAYSDHADPLPVLYHLHGTVFPALDTPSLAPATGADPVLALTGSGGGNQQVGLFDFAAQRSKAKFLVVAPDTDPNGSWCQTCLWIDGRQQGAPNIPPASAEPVPAESHLYTELMPLIEHLFNVQKGAGGRGITGFSMGGIGALIQGMRHPDRFSYVGSISGAFDLLNEEGVRTIAETVGYLRDQGYGTGVSNTVQWRNYNPADLVSNLAAQHVDLLLSAGDGCLPPAQWQSPDCARNPSLLNPASSALELALRRNADLSGPKLSSAGVPATQIRMPGMHGSNNHRVYSDVVVPGANSTFAERKEPTTEFSYRTADTVFDVFGYHVDVHREGEQFLRLDRVRKDGRSLRLTGSGIVNLSTPPTFAPNTTHLVRASAMGKPASQRIVHSDGAGRIHLTFDATTGLGQETDVARDAAQAPDRGPVSVDIDPN